jgi:hypothetical protein
LRSRALFLRRSMMINSASIVGRDGGRTRARTSDGGGEQGRAGRNSGGGRGRVCVTRAGRRRRWRRWTGCNGVGHAVDKVVMAVTTLLRVLWRCVWLGAKV